MEVQLSTVYTGRPCTRDMHLKLWGDNWRGFRLSEIKRHSVLKQNIKVKTLLPMNLLWNDDSTVAGVLRIPLRNLRTISSIFISIS